MEFIRPGVALKVFSAGVALDGTITVRLNLTDPKGLPLDRSLSCIERPIAERRIIIPLIRMEPQAIIGNLMKSHGAGCSVCEFHAAVNLHFHEFESEIYGRKHACMWDSLPR